MSFVLLLGIVALRLSSSWSPVVGAAERKVWFVRGGGSIDGDDSQSSLDDEDRSSSGWDPFGGNGSSPPSDDDDDDDDDEDDEDALAARAAQRWTRKAFELAQEGRMEKAAWAFSKAVEATPSDAPYRSSLLINVGSFLAFSGRASEALGPLREALALAPDDARALHALGNALHQCDASNEALDVYAKALDASPASDFPPNAPLLNNVATILLSMGERGLATKILERSLDIEPNAPGTLFNLAMAYYSQVLESVRRTPPPKVVDFLGYPLRLETEVLAATRDALRAGRSGDHALLRRVISLLDRAEPHSPNGSALRERVLALRGAAAGRVPGRERDAIVDLNDVLAHGAEHARDPNRRANALLELAQLETDDPDKRIDYLREAVRVLEARHRGGHRSSSDGDDAKQPHHRQQIFLPADDDAAAAKLVGRKSHKASSSASKKRHRPTKKGNAKILALGQPRDVAMNLRAQARAQLAAALVDRNDLEQGFDELFQAADDGLGASAALSVSPQAAKLRDADPNRFDHLLALVCRNDAFAAIQALTSAIGGPPARGGGGGGGDGAAGDN